MTQDDVSCLIAKAEREYLSRPGCPPIQQTVVRDGEVVVLDSDRKVLARYRATVARFRVRVERI
jgi:hypothetical protein